MGDAIGSFVNDWQLSDDLCISPTGFSQHTRYGDFCRVEGGRIVEMRYHLMDLPALLMQAGIDLIPPGAAHPVWPPGPATGDGLRREERDPADSARTLALVESMIITGLNKYDGANLASMGMKRFWTEDMRWYGPAGIGSTVGLGGFEQHHQIPFLHAFPDRIGGTEDTVWLAEGDYVACAGFPAMHMSHLGEYLGHPATNQRITMRDIDWWKRDGERLAEN